MVHKKQLFELFEGIAQLNNDVWGNPKGSYDAGKAAALLIEEALEKLPLSDKLAILLGCENKPKALARQIVALTVGDNLDDSTNEEVPEVSAMDSDLDSIYIAVGNLHMQGLRPHQMVEGLQIVHNANKTKAGNKDANDKVTKPDDFVEPEPLLQSILDKR